MKQYEAVIQVMRANSGMATLGFLYQEVLKVSGVEWNTKTPFASIRRIVQDSRFFFKIRPGLWALNEFKNKLPAPAEAKANTTAKEAEFTHSYYQGLLVEIGNMRHFDTYVPNQDKNQKFLTRPLNELITVHEFYPFTYAHLIQRARTIDVTWFNSRKLPDSFFEVEHSTDIYNSLVKFNELRDFNVNLRIIADKARAKEFQSKLAADTFREIAGHVRFVSYDTVSELHAKEFELSLIQRRW